MALVKSIKGKNPVWGSDCYLAENATIVGDVTLGDECSVWFNAVVRGDVHYIKIGNRVNIQDGAVIHCTYKKHPTQIGDNVSIGPLTLVYSFYNSPRCSLLTHFFFFFFFVFFPFFFSLFFFFFV